MSRRDRLKQGAAAKERVLSGMYNQPQATTAPSLSRRDRLRVDAEVSFKGMTPGLSPEPPGGYLVTNPLTVPQSNGMTPGLPATPPTGYLMNKLTSLPTTQPTTVTSRASEPPTGYLMNNLQGAAPAASLNLFNPPAAPQSLSDRRKQWLDEQQAVRDAQDPSNPFLKVLKDVLLDAPSQAIDYAQAYIPGVSAFQTGAGQALGIKTTAAPMQEGIGNKAAQFAGMFAGAAVNPAALEQSLITGPYAAGRALTNRVAPAAGNTTQRAITGAAAGGIQGGAYSLITGQSDAEDVARNVALGAGLGAAGDVALGALGSAFKKVFKRNGIPDEQANEILALPMGREDAARLRRANQTQTPDVIAPETPLGLPSPDIAPATTGRIARLNNPYRKQFEELMTRAQQMQREGRMTPGREDLDVESLWSQMAGRDGISLDELIQRAYPTRANRVTPDLVQRAKGNQQAREVAGAPMPVKSLSDRYPQGGQTGIPEGPITVPARASDNLPPAAKQAEESIDQARAKAEYTPSETPLTRPNVDDTVVTKGGDDAPSKPADNELGFIRTLRQSNETSPEMKRILESEKLKGTRTTDAINLAAAEQMITKNGIESAADRIISKKGTLNAIETTAAQLIARFYSETGQLERAIQVISKTASSGREMGQAIQALTRWNKLDQEGALLLAERQLNRLTTKTEEWKSLTAEQAKPVQDVARRLESVQDARRLADDVTTMLASRKPGTAFTAEERALIKQFSEQVRKTGEDVRPLVAKERQERRKTISDVDKVPPKQRTRDQVQKYLSAKADQARERLAQSRNRLSATPVDVWRDYIIIGADNFARGAIKFTDWAGTMINAGLTDKLEKAYVQSVRRFRKENGLPTSTELEQVINRALKAKAVDEQTANSLRAAASEIGFYADDVKLELTQDLQRAMRSLGSSTLGEKLASLQTSSMLLSAPTFFRNTLGNWGQMVMEKFSKVFAVPIDWTVSKLTGERTIQFFPHNQEKYWRNFVVGGKAGFEGIDPQGALSAYNLTPDVFKRNHPFKWLVQMTGASLKSGDYASYMAAYGDVVATFAEQMGKARGMSKADIKAQMPQLIKQLDQRVHDIADQAGLYATYQDETLLSRGAQGVKKALNTPTDMLGRAMRERGAPAWMSPEGIGLGDVVIKFAKTPANLVMRGIDYSPIGFMRSIYELAPLIPALKKRGATFNQRNAVMSLSRAIIGTGGLTLGGYILAKEGILTGAASSNPNIRSIEEQTGKGAYKANLSALVRWLVSGFDSDAAKYQKGDQMMDYNWLQPAAISLGMGVNLAENIDKPDKPGANVPEWKKYTGAILGGLRTILENPMMTGLQDVVDAGTKAITNQDVTGFANIAKGIPASFVPAVSGQLRSGMDPYQRDTFDQNPIKSMLNMVKNKVPWWSDTLPKSYDSLGNERLRYNYIEPNTLGSYLNQLLNPGKFSKYEVSPDAQLVLDVFGATNDTGVIPKMAKRTLTYTDPETRVEQRVTLTNEEFSSLQKRMGKLVSEGLLAEETYLSDPNIPADDKSRYIEKLLTQAGSEARNEYRRSKGYPEKG